MLVCSKGDICKTHADGKNDTLCRKYPAIVSKIPLAWILPSSKIAGLRMVCGLQCILASAKLGGCTMKLAIPLVESVVIPDLNAFLVSLSHLPTEVQIDLLRQATGQITDAVEKMLA